MKFLKTVGAMTLLVGSAAAIAAPTYYGSHKARSLGEVDSIWLDSNSCTAGITDELEDSGFDVTRSSRAADANLRIAVQELHANGDNGTARYTVTLRGDDGDVLFQTAVRLTATSGSDSIDYAKMCDNIGEDVVERIENRLG